MNCSQIATILLCAAGLALVLPATAQDETQDEIPRPDEILDTIPVPALKAEAPADDAVNEPGVTRLEEIVVTANKRAESTRTLAGAVTAIDSERLAEAGHPARRHRLWRASSE